MTDMATKLFQNFRLLTMQTDKPYGMMDGHSLLVRDGKIEWIGADSEVADKAAGATVVEGQGKCLSPGLIDCHTHLIYGGNRADEWEQRLAGVPYEEIARRGGGILSTVKATRQATEDELFSTARKRLERFMSQGVTTVEIKSGYGLDLETELKMLRVARRLQTELPIRVQTTLLAAHAVPPEFTGNSDAYVDLVCDTIIPAAVELADAVDVFCESIAFTLSQTERVFRAAIDAGLAIKVHAEQLSHTSAAALAAGMGALSADHLEHLSPDDCAILAEHGTVATLLPGAYYTLKETTCPPIASLREAGTIMAIASDANPGSSPMASILLVANMACSLFGMTAEESIAGLTCNAARALGLADQIGTLEVGKQADLVIWDIDSPAELAYGVGHDPCEVVYFAGQRISEVDGD